MPFVKDASRAVEVLREQGVEALKHKIGQRLVRGGAMGNYSFEAMTFASWMDFSHSDLIQSRKVHADNPGKLDIQTITWFLPEFKHVYYGGIYTLLRFADYVKRVHDVNSCFQILGKMDAAEVAEKIAQGFPNLKGQPVGNFSKVHHIRNLQPSDAGIATLWGTSYFLLHYNQTRRKFYFMQDYEPLFYPAGSIYAQVEASYRFGYYGIANTPTIKNIYEEQYGGTAESFVPCVDTGFFHPPAGRRPQEPLKIFFYGRPGHARNGFELGAQALRILKKRLGKRIQIVSAGDRWTPKDYGLHGVVENLGLLQYHETADLYRTCHAGLVMMFTRHPSYLPLELMASGSLVITNYNPATTWLLKDRENCRLSEASATYLADVMEEALLNETEYDRITSQAAELIRTSYSHWEGEMEKIYQYMCAQKDEAGRQ